MSEQPQPPEQPPEQPPQQPPQAPPGAAQQPYARQPSPPPPGYVPTAPPLAPDQERTWATMSHVLTLPAMLIAMAFLAPLVIMLAYGNRSAWVRRHAVESLNFQITALLLGAAAGVASVVTFGLALVIVIPLALVYGVFWLIVILMATFAANRGEDYRYPLTLRLVK